MTDTAPAELRSQRRAARRAENRSEILDAAERVFGEDGLRTGSLRRIANLSGYSTAAIYKFFDSKQHLVAEVLTRRGDEYLNELRQAAQSDGTPLDRLHLIVDTAAAYFRERAHFRSVLRQIKGGSAILGPVLDAFAEDVYGRYADAMNLMTDLVRQGQHAREIRDGDPGGIAHLASVLTNEYALADVALAPSEFHAVFDGALRAPPLC
ncbi:helix-turn-helix domain containing protein [Mycobacterium sp. CVI_P3]|uniref:Helix-turn-helix domain containing protein n=1 Tax=Mycobacterium pinniadriaticum TaxID=2994102 RepID=A0ABT3SHR2_9MYCO|nr:TetR/AcrR family transcriptional regulator [Mycobacterium pinniadriaticum]MCX2932620.1 helix-turn-helix domain containing protein [Mycobacterium pinniadriaticum]MCX2939044.1 helix-turn-helix domain containing protein [Mycobacterium pinniadriaticum]